MDKTCTIIIAGDNGVKIMTQEQIKNILYAGIVGDALGVPVEFSQRDTYFVDEMTGNGTWDQPAGSWSDDSSMTLALAQNLVAQGSYDDLMQRFAGYVYDGKLTPNGETFDVGNTTNQAVQNYERHHMAPLDCGVEDENANGNGAIMRLAPLAIELVGQEDLNTRLNIITEYTSLTHRHPRAIVGSLIYVEMLRELLLGADLPSALMNVQSELTTSSLDQLYLNEFVYYERIFDGGFKDLPADEINSTGYVVDTLEAAIWVALNHSDFQDAVVAAVNLGEDTDTIASIVGAIVASATEPIQIPANWSGAIQNRTLIDEIVEPFAQKYSA